MNGKYSFTRDTYIYNNKEEVKISSYNVPASPQEQRRLVREEFKMTPFPFLIIQIIKEVEN